MRSSAPAISKMSVPKRMRLTSVLTPVSLLPPTDWIIAVRSYSPIPLLRIAMKRMETSVVKPSPPIWMRQMMTTCPKVVQWSAVTTGVSPVTQVADVATNSPSR